jgi:hypothetical protein
VSILYDISPGDVEFRVEKNFGNIKNVKKKYPQLSLGVAVDSKFDTLCTVDAQAMSRKG